MQLTTEQRAAAEKSLGIRLDAQPTDDAVQVMMRELLAEKVTAAHFRHVTDTAGHVGKAFRTSDGREARFDSADETRLDRAIREANERITTQWCRTDAEREKALSSLSR